MPQINIIKEACVESLDEAILAEQLGANRIELCARLDLDGLTPNISLVSEVIKSVQIPIKVIIRPHANGFSYSKNEMSEILLCISQYKELPVSGFVFGATENGKLDMQSINQVVECAYPIPITVHKAIDTLDNPIDAVRQLVQEGKVDSILTSGGHETALLGASVIREMLDIAHDKVKIIVAGRVTSQNINDVKTHTGGVEFHGRKIVGELN